MGPPYFLRRIRTCRSLVGTDISRALRLASSCSINFLFWLSEANEEPCRACFMSIYVHTRKCMSVSMYYVRRTLTLAHEWVTNEDTTSVSTHFTPQRTLASDVINLECAHTYTHTHAHIHPRARWCIRIHAYLDFGGFIRNVYVARGLASADSILERYTFFLHCGRWDRSLCFLPLGLTWLNIHSYIY